MLVLESNTYNLHCVGMRKITLLEINRASKMSVRIMCMYEGTIMLRFFAKWKGCILKSAQ